tara:strand:- start:66 stop:386 length:321 start_codon:yes stop_codon:yes gene_type:complete
MGQSSSYNNQPSPHKRAQTQQGQQQCTTSKSFIFTIKTLLTAQSMHPFWMITAKEECSARSTMQSNTLKRSGLQETSKANNTHPMAFIILSMANTRAQHTRSEKNE